MCSSGSRANPGDSQFPLSVRTAGVPGSWYAPTTTNRDMSTSHYASRPNRAQTPPRNTRRYTAGKLITIGILLVVDVMAFGGAQDLRVATTFAALAIINCAVLARFA